MVRQAHSGLHRRSRCRPPREPVHQLGVADARDACAEATSASVFQLYRLLSAGDAVEEVHRHPFSPCRVPAFLSAVFWPRHLFEDTQTSSGPQGPARRRCLLDLGRRTLPGGLLSCSGPMLRPRCHGPEGRQDGPHPAKAMLILLLQFVYRRSG